MRRPPAPVVRTKCHPAPLHRAVSAEEVQYYATQLDAGTLSRAGAVINFSDSPEHIALTAPDIMSENLAQFGIAFA
ncbi:DUF4214 domain-containing protein [Roseomonas sp. BN140053]|uniref:DUF4214 domain-containing protein n=1 Tax=Roseomonas sp. BN140053 TaxID=3391898 RepID=UPI0039EBB8C9